VFQPDLSLSTILPNDSSWQRLKYMCPVEAAMSLFPDTPDLIKDNTPLDSPYATEFYVENGDRASKLAEQLAPVLKGRSPGTIILHGNPGSGKSVTTHYVFDQLEGKASDLDVELTTLYEEIERGDTAYQVLISIVNGLHALLGEDEISNTGNSHKFVREALYRALDEFEGVLVIALDDAHLLDEPDTLLNDLSRARQRGDVDVKTGLILIANDASFLDDLSSDTKSTLNSKTLSFPAYNANELSEMLRRRTEAAFHEDTFSQGVIPRIAGLAAKEGDARHGLDLLEGAAEQAQRRLREEDDPNDGDKQVTERDLMMAEQTIENDWFADTVSGLAMRQRAVLYVIVELACGNNTPCRTSEIHRGYNKFAEESITERTLRNPLADLTTQSVLKRYEKNEGAKRNGKGGQYFEYELAKGLPVVLKAIKGLSIAHLSEPDIEVLCKKAIKKGVLTKDQKNEILIS
jgi:cell division control protein 6